MTGWDNFFVAELGASAALADLLFVGVSINMTRILAIPTLPARALRALIMLVAILFVSSLFLVPGSPSPYWAWRSVRRRRGLGRDHTAQPEATEGGGMAIPRRIIVFEVLLGQVAVLPYIAAAFVMLTLDSEGVYLIVPAVLISFADAILDAWVLLVEINR